MLYQLGVVQFEVAPVNVSEVELSDGADFATKDVVGAMRPLEFVGEQNQRLHFSGTLFPHKLGGLVGLEALENMARSGESYNLMRGDLKVLGRFVIERLEQKHNYLNNKGIGREIRFEIFLVKSNKRPSEDVLRTQLASSVNILQRLFG